LPKTKPVEPLTNPADVDALREVLEKKRLELINLYEHDVHSGQESADDSADDSIDRANNSFNRELMFSLSDTERQMLIQVEEAVERLDNGEYGQCTHCSQPIGLARLRAVPWARYCIDCQESEERGVLVDR
jgi:DnaK suppressor protein